MCLEATTERLKTTCVHSETERKWIHVGGVYGLLLQTLQNSPPRREHIHSSFVLCSSRSNCRVIVSGSRNSGTIASVLKVVAAAVLLYVSCINAAAFSEIVLVHRCNCKSCTHCGSRSLSHISAQRLRCADDDVRDGTPTSPLSLSLCRRARLLTAVISPMWTDGS